MNPPTIIIIMKVILNCKLIITNNFIKRIMPYLLNFDRNPAKIIKLETIAST